MIWAPRKLFLDPSWGVFGASCRLEGIVGRVGIILDRLGGILEANLAALEALWKPYWAERAIAFHLLLFFWADGGFCRTPVATFPAGPNGSVSTQHT
eukprot:6288211-Pyramimonas_sp.AAC.2